MKFQGIKISEIFTKIVQRFGTRAAHIYLPRKLIGKKVFVIVPKNGDAEVRPDPDDKGTWKHGIHPELFCDICEKPLVSRRGQDIETCPGHPKIVVATS